MELDLSLGSIGPFRGPSANLKAEYLNTTENTEGCEQVIAQANQYNNTVLNVKCTINSHISSATNQINAVNEIDISYGTLNCSGDFITNQTIDVKSLSASSLTQKIVDDITTNIVTGLEALSELMQTSKSGFGSTGKGQKILQQNQTNLTSDNSKKQINEQISKTLNSIFANNKLNLSHINAKATNCKFTQDVVIDVVAKTLVEDTFTTYFREYITAQQIVRDTITQTNESQGSGGLGLFNDINENIPIIVSAVIGCVVVLICACCIWKNMPTEQNRESDDD